MHSFAMLSPLAHRLAKSNPFVRSRSSVPVDSLCIPLTPPYSINAILTPPNHQSALLPQPTLHRLHKLAGLPYPSCSAEDIAELVGVVDGIRTDTVARLLAEAENELGPLEPGWGKAEIVFDGKTEFSKVGEVQKEVLPNGRELMQDSKKTLRDYYVVDRKQL